MSVPRASSTAGNRKHIGPHHRVNGLGNESAAERVGQGLVDAHIGEIADQRVVRTEVHDTVVLGAPLKFARIALRTAGHQHTLHRTDHCPRVRLGLAAKQVLENRQTMPLDARRRAVRQARRGRPRTRAIDEAEGNVVVEFLDQGERLLEVTVGLAGESDDEVR